MTTAKKSTKPKRTNPNMSVNPATLAALREASGVHKVSMRVIVAALVYDFAALDVDAQARRIRGDQPARSA